MAGLSWAVAVLGGLAYFFSPCVWPLYPAYVSYLVALEGAGAEGARGRAGSRGAGRGGRSVGTARGARSGGAARGGWSGGAARRLVVRQALGFILGFSLVFLALGASASALGRLLLDYQEPFRRVAGLLVVGFGLYLAGLIPSWVLGSEVRLGMPKGGPPFLAAVAMGASFGFGWTPCVGPILASILVLTSTAADLAKGVGLLAAFSLGLALPFFALALFLDRLGPLLGRAAPALPWVRRLGGLVLVVLGVMVYAGSFAQLASWLYYTL